MLPKNRISTHPGVVLLEEFLKPMGLSQTKLSDHLGIPIQRINEIVNKKRGVTPETAWLFAGAFETTPEFWLNLQSMYDLSSSKPDRDVEPISQSLS